MAHNFVTALIVRWLKPRPLAFVGCWVLFVLLPAALAGTSGGVRLAQAAVGAESLPFLRHCPAPLLVVHLQAYAALVPAVLFLVWGYFPLAAPQQRPRLRAMLTPLWQGVGLLVATQFCASVASMAVGGWNAELIVSWALRLFGYNLLFLLTLMSLVLALACGFRRYGWVVLATVTLGALQSLLSGMLILSGAEPWLPSQLRVQLLSGSGSTAQAALALVGWMLLSVAVLLVRIWSLPSRRLEAAAVGIPA